MRVLIIGIDSAIGLALGEALRSKGHDVVGTSRRATSLWNGPNIQLDLNDQLLPLDTIPNSDVVICCAAMSKFADCAQNPDMAYRINVASPQLIARHISTRGGRFVMLSTSAVLACDSPFALSSAPYQPRSLYGKLKAESEKVILTHGQNNCVFRLTKVITPEMPLFLEWIQKLQNSDSVTAFSDLRIAPITLDDVTQNLIAVVTDKGNGIYQISGNKDVSYAEIATYFSQKIGVSPELVQASLAAENGINSCNVTSYTSLNTQRVSNLTSWAPPPPEEVFTKVFEF